MSAKKAKNRPTREEFKARCQMMYDEIASKIRNNELLPGACLPSEENLGKKHGISRESVRNVIAQMISHGLVTRIKGKGVIVGQLNNNEKAKSTVGILLPSENEVDIAKSEDFDPYILKNRTAVIFSSLEHKFLEAGLNVKFLTKDILFRSSTSDAIKFLKENVSGIAIVYDITPEIMNLAATVAGKGIGIVFVPMYVPCPPLTSGVTWDNYQAGRMAAEHLKSLGHNQLACLGLDYNFPWMISRISGFTDYCKENDINYNVIKGSPERKSNTYPGSEICRQIADNYASDLLKKHKATGVFAVNDGLAFGVYEKLTKNRIKIPEDFSIVGCDNDHSLPWREMTTFNLECIRTAEAAAEALINYLKNENHLIWPVELKIQPRLIIRQSAAPPPKTK
jgi:DNA-binding LacI/PurR family transcriptional regulator